MEVGGPACSSTVFKLCLSQGATGMCPRKRRGEQSRKWRAAALLSSQSGHLRRPHVWDAAAHVLFLQHRRCVELRSSACEERFSDVVRSSDGPLSPPSFCHHCGLLPGVCLCPLQLPGCPDGPRWLWHCEVRRSFLVVQLLTVAVTDV